MAATTTTPTADLATPKAAGGSTGGGSGSGSSESRSSSARMVFTRWLVAGSSAMVAETITYPIDTLRTVLQLDTTVGKGRVGALQSLQGLVKHEGVGAIYAGLGPALARQLVYGGIGVGLYHPVRALLIGNDTTPEHAPLYKRMLAGATTGGLGQLAAQPLEVLKSLLQGDRRLRLQGLAPRYQGTWSAVGILTKSEGLSGFYKGSMPSVQRAAIINGASIAAYDHSKYLISRWFRTTQGVQAKIYSSLISGLVAAVVSTPYDVIRNRLINQSHTHPLYKGTIDCALKTIKQEGFGAMYKGFALAYMRLAPWQIVFFLLFEEIAQNFPGVGEL